MRFVILSAVLFAPVVASAQPIMSETCKTVSAVPADSTDAQLALAAKISLANCEAEASFNAITLTPDDASMQALTTAAQPALQLYDDVIRSGDPMMVPLARAARADLFDAMAVRMRDSIAPVTMTTTGAPLAEHDREHTALEPKLQPWLDQAQAPAQ